ncbi:CapA family protein [Paenibacillus guangzhouensis]|uniref:CapA family protein n=1 Tax=Paenibacillus guangzhouensis TaxID=1473112 RepID=UPI0012668F0D|nr:CapA family protein [Paenibacillus guangzhouensis]
MSNLNNHDKRRSRLALFFVLIAVILLLVSCQVPSQEVQPKPDASRQVDALPVPPAPTTEKTESSEDTDVQTEEQTIASYTKEAKLVAVGDVMMHMPQMPAYYDKATGKYNFNPYFTQVKPILEQGDFVWANLETPIAGADLRYSGFPMFNAPPELASALKYAGFNIVTTANNHAMDRKEIGIIRTLKRLKEQGFVTKGTAASEEESKQLTIMTKNDIKMGILAYTYGTNGITLPKDKPYLVAHLSPLRIKEDIRALREAGADVVVIALHFGIEYQREPNSTQQELARSLIQAGADIILGSHPHVIQPLEQVNVKESDGSLRKGYIIYSMGNFISNMKDEYTDYGVIFHADIQKTFPSGKIDIRQVDTQLTWTQKTGKGNARKYVILPVEKTIQEHRLQLSASTYQSLKKKQKELDHHLHSLAVPVLVQAAP